MDYLIIDKLPKLLPSTHNLHICLQIYVIVTVIVHSPLLFITNHLSRNNNAPRARFVRGTFAQMKRSATIAHFEIFIHYPIVL